MKKNIKNDKKYYIESYKESPNPKLIPMPSWFKSKINCITNNKQI